MPFHDAISLFHKVPKLGLGMYPTPVEEMPRLRAALGSNAPQLFVMRDDYTGPGFGGNKGVPGPVRAHFGQGGQGRGLDALVGGIAGAEIGEEHRFISD